MSPRRIEGTAEASSEWTGQGLRGPGGTQLSDASEAIVGGGKTLASALIPIVGILGCVGKNTSFSLDEHYSAFIEEEIASGRYRSASDVVRTALRLLEDRETRLRALRQALIAGERSGESTQFDFDDFVARKRAEKPRHG